MVWDRPCVAFYDSIGTTLYTGSPQPDRLYEFSAVISGDGTATHILELTAATSIPPHLLYVRVDAGQVQSVATSTPNDPTISPYSI